MDFGNDELNALLAGAKQAEEERAAAAQRQLEEQAAAAAAEQQRLAEAEEQRRREEEARLAQERGEKPDDGMGPIKTVLAFMGAAAMVEGAQKSVEIVGQIGTNFFGLGTPERTPGITPELSLNTAPGALSTPSTPKFMA